jgi:hypothetical protein
MDGFDIGTDTDHRYFPIFHQNRVAIKVDTDTF